MDGGIKAMLVAFAIALGLVLLANWDALRRLLPRSEPGMLPDRDVVLVEEGTRPRRDWTVTVGMLLAIGAAVALAVVAANEHDTAGKLQRRVQDLEGQVDELDSRLRRLERGY